MSIMCLTTWISLFLLKIGQQKKIYCFFKVLWNAVWVTGLILLVNLLTVKHIKNVKSITLTSTTKVGMIIYQLKKTTSWKILNRSSQMAQYTYRSMKSRTILHRRESEIINLERKLSKRLKRKSSVKLQLNPKMTKMLIISKVWGKAKHKEERIQDCQIYTKLWDTCQREVTSIKNMTEMLTLYLLI